MPRTIADYLATFPNITEMQRAVLRDAEAWIAKERTDMDEVNRVQVIKARLIACLIAMIDGDPGGVKEMIDLFEALIDAKYAELYRRVTPPPAPKE